MIKKITILSFFFMLNACKKEDSILYITKDSFKIEITLTSKSIDGISQLTPSTLTIIDSLLVVSDYLENPRIHFYNKNTLDKVAEYGFVGEGPEEYFAPELNGGVYHKNYGSDSYIRIYEFGYGLLHEVNLTSILNGKTPTKINKYYLNPDIYNADNIFVIGDGLYGEATDNETVKYFKTSLKDMSEYEKIGIMNSDDILDNAPVEDRVNFDRSYMDYSNHNKKFVSVYLRYNKINILNKNFDELKTIVYGSKKLGPETNDLMSADNVYYFTQPYCGKDYIYVSYLGKKSGLRSNPEEIQVYDYDGKPIKRLLLDMPIKSFTVDEQDHKLYAITDSEENTYVVYDLNQ